MARDFAHVRCVFAFLVSLLPLASATAEPVQVNASIRAGEIVIRFPGFLNGIIDIHGDHGFQFESIATSGSSLAFCGPCVPGQTVSLGTNLATPFGGTLRYRGTEYPFNFNDGAGEIRLIADSFVLPISSGQIATFSSSFSLQGYLSTANPLDHIVFNLGGGGVVTGTFRVFPLPPPPDVPGQQQCLLDSLVYEFGGSAAPVPERATLALLALGFAASFRGKRKSSDCSAPLRPAHARPPGAPLEGRDAPSTGDYSRP